KPLTVKGVLRRADVGPAATALGLPDPGWVRTAADVEAMHHAWVAAEGAGLLTLWRDRAVAATPAERDPVAQWLAGLRAVLRAESNDPSMPGCSGRIGATVLCRAVLGVLDAGRVRDVLLLERAVEQALRAIDLLDAEAAYEAFRGRARPRPVRAGLGLLAECGAVDAGTMTVTPLGRWARGPLAERVEPTMTRVSASDDEVFQLDIRLRGFRPPLWRRVLMPARADLGLLHRVIQIVLSWDDDHLHVFTAGGDRYGDPCHGLDCCADEGGIALAALLPRPGLSIDYLYDMGYCWDNTITLEKIVEREDDRCYPCCVGGRRDAPVEDWDPDSPEETIPFDRDLINQRLAALSGT
ncbi:MAG: plasmid pRiA4b ORF-3 family protein, partial [Egibacteraceae bacterium]